MKRRYGIELVVLALAMTLTACSSSSEQKTVYGSKQEQRPLEVPPDLSTPHGGESMSIPAIASGQTSYSYYKDEGANGSLALLSEADDVRFVRDGSMHWLEVRRKPGQVWRQVGDFLRSLGFEIKYQNQHLGIMETNWLENREEAPANWFKRLFSSTTSSGLMDRYRVRFERTPKGHTRLFMTHRGLKKADTSGGDGETAWLPRESDPELEAEMLQRFLVYSGVGEQQAMQTVTTAKATDHARLKEQAGSYVLQVNENFPRTWRRVGLALDRLGLLVEDRNRSAGVYYIKLTEEFKNKQKQGFWASLFSGRGNRQIPDELLLKVDEQDGHTDVILRDRQGSVADAKLAQRLLKELEVHLR